MVLDSSVVVAILLREREGPAFVDALASARTAIIGAPSLLEVQMVLLREYPDTVEAELERFLSAFDVTLLPFGPDEYRHAAGAFRRYGKGRHPARLNFGDCMAYAASKSTGDSRKPMWSGTRRPPRNSRFRPAACAAGSAGV